MLHKARFKMEPFFTGRNIMSYKNYILIQKHLFRSEYIFADTEEYLADQLFKNEKIRVNFGKEYGHTEEKYLLVSCKIWNKDRSH